MFPGDNVAHYIAVHDISDTMANCWLRPNPWEFQPHLPKLAANFNKTWYCHVIVSIGNFMSKYAAWKWLPPQSLWSWLLIMIFMTDTRFPWNDPERLQKWVRNISWETNDRKSWQPSKYDKVCRQGTYFGEWFLPAHGSWNAGVQCGSHQLSQLSRP